MSSGARKAATSDPLTRAQAIATVADYLDARGVDDAQEDARALLRAATGLTRLELAMTPRAPLSDEEARALSRYAARRAAREPVSRILGERGFLDARPRRRARQCSIRGRHGNAGRDGVALRCGQARRAALDSRSRRRLGRHRLRASQRASGGARRRRRSLGGRLRGDRRESRPLRPVRPRGGCARPLGGGAPGAFRPYRFQSPLCAHRGHRRARSRGAAP